MMNTHNSSAPLRFLLCGGGTGGHVYPAIAIADGLKKAFPESEILFAGSRKNIEARVVPQRGYSIRFIHAKPFPLGKNPWHLLKMSVATAIGVAQAFRILLSFRPSIVIALGGYVAAPTVFAWLLLNKAWILRIPCFVHEQNVFPGKMNRLAGALADCVGISFAESAAHFPAGKISFVGYPVRHEIQGWNREEARKELGIDPHHRVVLAFGGSQGSRTINRAVVDALSHLSGVEGLTLIHATGQGRKGWEYDPPADTARRMTELGIQGADVPWYRQLAYIDHIDKYYAASDLVICRAGAGTLSEIMLCGLPSIIIPKADLAADHQVRNAMVLERKGAATVLFERPELENGTRVFHVQGQELAEMVKRLLSDPEKRGDMSLRAREMAFPDATDRIVRQIRALLERNDVLYPLPRDRGKNDVDWAGLSLDRAVSLLKASRRKSTAVRLSEADRRYMQYKLDLALSSANFLMVCRGARLAGLIGCVEQLPRLLKIMEARRPAPLWQRLLGGDFIPVGFVRRDIMEGLQWLGVWNETVHRLLHMGLEDPYFETRCAAARAIAALADKIENHGSIEEQLRRCLWDSNVEVVWESMCALGKITQDACFLEVLQGFRFHSSWKIRQAALNAMADLLRRNIVTVPQVSTHMEGFLTTCNEFMPRFPLKQSLLELKNLIDSLEGGGAIPSKNK